MADEKKDQKPASKPEDKKPEVKAEDKPAQETPAQVESKDEAEVIEAVEEHVVTDFTEQPDLSAQRAVEAHRQAKVGRPKPLSTGDTSAVHPQPDAVAVPDPANLYAEPEGEHQSTEQPDRYAVGDKVVTYADEKSAKSGKRGRRAKVEESAEHVESPNWPAQYEGDGKDQHPAQYSW
jgi:hypothetical protein